MKIHVDWHRPIKLLDGSTESLIFRPSRTAIIPKAPGIYLFCRKHGTSVSPLYIGKAENLARRIEQQLNNLKLMVAIQRAASGDRILLIGQPKLLQGQRAMKVLRVLENSLIDHALSEGHELLNIQGTKTKVHYIENKGNRDSRKVAPLSMHARSRD